MSLRRQRNSKEQSKSSKGMTSPRRATSSRAQPPGADACKLSSELSTPKFEPTWSSNVFSIQVLRATSLHFTAPRDVNVTVTPRGANHRSLVSSCSSVACNFLLGPIPLLPTAAPPPGRAPESVPVIGCEHRRLPAAAAAAFSDDIEASVTMVFCGAAALSCNGRRPCPRYSKWWSKEQYQRPPIWRPTSAANPWWQKKQYFPNMAGSSAAGAFRALRSSSRCTSRGTLFSISSSAHVCTTCLAGTAGFGGLLIGSAGGRTCADTTAGALAAPTSRSRHRSRLAIDPGKPVLRTMCPSMGSWTGSSSSAVSSVRGGASSLCGGFDDGCCGFSGGFVGCSTHMGLEVRLLM
mmetsp:Transcript_58444/g.169556  ORF Transcript_58444/g.169556 Transcript_58444/m.169556 type:complete len:350 (-) Transcript_58444:415-1464(-)